MILRWTLAAALLAAASCVAGGDEVHLSDGTRLEGTVARAQGGWTVTDAAGNVTFAPDDRVTMVRKDTASPGADAAFASLKRWAQSADDLAAIINRYTAFIEQRKGTPVAEAAAEELELWKLRQSRGLVKSGGAWVSPDELLATRRRIAESVAPIREMIDGGRLREAEGAIKELPALDPDNAAAIYLRGVVHFKQGQTGLARRSFERVRELLPDHAPTLNNLAVILYQQRQQVPALALYELAILAAPGTRQILENMAEALHALPAAQQQSSVVKRISRRFADQDAELRDKLAAEGLYRWGGSYLTAAEMQEVRRQSEQVKQRLDALEQEQARLGEQLAAIDRRIRINQEAMDRINRNRWYTDQDGRRVLAPPPSIYYEIRREIDLLRDEAALIQSRLGEFDRRAAEIRRDEPRPQFTARQRIIETEGTPLPSETPATRPAPVPPT